ncbi:MAG: hypothetical protein HYV33_03760 [Candidatus Kerfeldbacteria bacterium]|nr:hypothetical protein [Candidatus Kerfeldbacteria bacterium]
MKFKNTLQKGSVRYVVFKEGEDWYAVGLEFNIIESGTTPQEALLLLFEALQGYVETAQKIKARPAVLNQRVDSEYERMFAPSRVVKDQKREIFTIGEFSLSTVKALAFV